MDNLIIIEKGMPLLLKGLIVTLELGVAYIALGLVLGLAIAFAQVYGNRFMTIFCAGFVQIFLGIPAMVLLFLFYFSLSQFGFNLSAFAASLIAMGLRSAAYQSQVFRGGIQSIKSEQIIAAKALGMNLFQRIRYVVFPQALRYSLAPWSNEYASQIKDSSLCYAIGVTEMMRQGSYIVDCSFGNAMLVYISIALIYLIITYFGIWLLRCWEARLRVPGFEIG